MTNEQKTALLNRLDSIALLTVGIKRAITGDEPMPEDRIDDQIDSLRDICNDAEAAISVLDRVAAGKR